MKHDSLFEITGLIGLDGQDVKRMTLAKRGALMGAVVAKEFDNLLSLSDDEMLEKVKTLKFNFKHLKDVEKELFNKVYLDNLVTKKLHLLSCDLNYYSAGVEILEYHTKEEVYKSHVEQLRAELLEEGDATIEAAMLFVILRDSGIIHDIFSLKEQQEINSNLIALSAKDKMVAAVLEIRFKDELTNTLALIIKKKRDLFKNPYLEGLAVMFPFLDRRSSIFVDTVIANTDVKERRDNIMAFIKEKGFDVKAELVQDRILLKIENGYYSLWPTTRVFNRVPVQGIVLSPYYL